MIERVKRFGAQLKFDEIVEDEILLQSMSNYQSRAPQIREIPLHRSIGEVGRLLKRGGVKSRTPSAVMVCATFAGKWT